MGDESIIKKDLVEVSPTFTVTLKALIDRMTTLTDNKSNNNQRISERAYQNRVPRSGKYHVDESSNSKADTGTRLNDNDIVNTDIPLLYETFGVEEFLK